MLPKTIRMGPSLKPVIQVLLGLCLGVALSIIMAPCPNESPSPMDTTLPKGKYPELAPDPVKNVPNFQYDKDYWNSDDFEPRHKTLPKPSGKRDARDKTLRPRYISTELGIREKLFVGLLTSKDKIDTYGIAVNKTLSQYVTKLVFFMNSRRPSLPSGMSIVIFSDEKARLLPFHMLKYVGEHYVKSYDWFFFLKEDTYVRGHKLFDLVNKLSVGSDVILGRPVPSDAGYYCDVNSGVLLSQGMMAAVTKHAEWCMENFVSHDDTLNIGQCILHATNMKSCSSHVSGNNITFFTDASFSFDTVRQDTRQLRTLGNAMTVHRMKDDTNIYKLHRYYCEKELERVLAELEQVKQNITTISSKTPNQKESLSWPLGSDLPTQPRSRFDVIRWDYFTETHVYLDSDVANIKELKGVQKEDIVDVIKTSMEQLASKHGPRYSYKQLVNGYRRFDAARGMEYVLDLGLYDRDARSACTKRVRLMRPLGFVELVPMPYVTENSRVNLVLPVTLDNRDSVVSFLDSYANTCLESGDNTYLFVVFVYKEEGGGGGGVRMGDKDVYAVLKSMVAFYENKYQNGARIAWTAVQSSRPTQYTIMDTISRKFPADSLFLICSVGMELSIEFLNRVRMNTIVGWQVFFPIGFWQYKPNLVYDEKPFPTAVEIDQKVGHFDSHSYAYSSFYNSDYQYARKQMISTSASRDVDLYDMFLKYHNLHVFRAVEPALKLRFRLQHCAPTLKEEAYHRCLASRGQGLASRAQLAMLIFEHQQKLDQLQMNVMHQQNDRNVVQMKPDMLRK